MSIHLWKLSKMKNYRNLILNALLDRYERSSYFKGITIQKRKISIILHKVFPEYGKSDCFAETDLIEKHVHELFEKQYIKAGKINEFGNREIILNMDEEILDQAYKDIGRVQLKDNRELFLEEINQYKTESFINEFILYIRNRTLHFQTLSPYLENNSITDLRNIINILNKMVNQKEEISFRKFSILTLHDSKKLEKYKLKIFHIIHDFYDQSIEDENDAFECFNIIRNPSYVYLKGNMIIQIHNQIIDLNELHNHFAMASENIKDLTILSIAAKQVMTVENLTSFHDLELDDTLIVYLGGYHNTLRRNFLLRLYEFLKNSVTYYHFGDIDAGGFYIYLDLVEKTKIPFQTYKMDVETLIKYKEYTKNLTQNDRLRLVKLKEIYYNPVIDYMLENSMKLEQEIVD